MRSSWRATIGILSAALWIAVLGWEPSVSSADETLDQRRARLEKMSPVDKDELRRNQKRLDQLKLDQQQQLRDVEQQLAKDPQGDQLRKVMLRYHEWLRALPSAERADLLSLSDDERISKISALLEKQETERLRELAKAALSRADVEQVRAWFGELVVRKKSDLLQQLPEHSREKLTDIEDPRRLLFELSNQFWDKSKPPPLIRIMEVLKIDEEERLRLVGNLSSPAGDVYRRQVSEQDKHTVLQNWVYATMSRPRMPSTDELGELLNSLSAEERDRIENLPPEQMKAELTRHFFFDRMRRWNSDGKRPFSSDGFKGGDSRKRGPSKPISEAEKPEK